MCIFEHCTAGDQQYDSLKDWLSHELICCSRGPRNLNSAAAGSQFNNDFLRYSTADDGDVRSKTSKAAEAVRGISSSLESMLPCPICLKTKVSYSHIGEHLQRIALFALPRSTYLDEDKDVESMGKVFHGSDSQDLADDLDEISLPLEEVEEDEEGQLPQEETDMIAPLTIEFLKSISITDIQYPILEPASSVQRFLDVSASVPLLRFKFLVESVIRRNKRNKPSFKNIVERVVTENKRHSLGFKNRYSFGGDMERAINKRVNTNAAYRRYDNVSVLLLSWADDSNREVRHGNSIRMNPC